MVLPTKDIHSAQLPQGFDYNSKLTSLTEQEALDLIDTKVHTTGDGRDPLHLAMHKTWFVAITHLLNLRTQTYMDLLQDVDSNFLPRDSAYTANHIMRHVMFQVARLAGITPEFEGVPMNTDPDDMFASKMAEACVAYINKQQSWDDVRLVNAYWLCLTGNGFIQNYWDPSLGKLQRQYKNPLNGQSVKPSSLTADDIQALKKRGGVLDERTGEISMSALSPFQVTVPRRATDLKNSAWVIIEEEVDPAWIWDRYPKTARNLERDDFGTSQDSFYWDRVRHLANRYGVTLPTSGIENSEMVKIRTMWIPPSGWCPDGFMIRATRKQICEIGPHPFWNAGLDPRDPDFDHLRYPVDHARYCRVPGRFWGMGLVENLIGPQQQYNHSIDQIVRQRDRMGKATWITPSDSELMHDGDVWVYNKNSSRPPEVVQAPQIGQSQIVSSEAALQDMRVIAAQSDPSMGQVPQGVRSGVAISLLQEKDDVSSAPTIFEMQRQYVRVQNRNLAMAWKFWETARVVQIVGEVQTGKANMFKGSELNGNVFVEIRPTSMKMKSKAAAMELAMNMMQMGALNPQDPRHLSAFMDSVEFNGIDHLFKGMRLNEDRARQEETMFMRPRVDKMTGKLAPWPAVDDHDDHLVHLESHRSFKVSDIYENLPIVAKLAFDQHMREHEEHLADMMAAEQMMGQGASPGGGSPPAPVGEASQPADKNPTPGPQQAAGGPV